MKFIKVITLLILFFGQFNSIAQEYISTLEETVFKAYDKDSINYQFIKSISAIDEDILVDEISSFQEKLDAFIKTLPEKEDREKRERKRVKKIYDLTHKKFLRKYEDIAYFPQLINDGIYNCVTSSALYAYIFDELSIPYHVKDLPTHVYLIAYPNTLNIELETTAPGTYGFVSRDASEIKEAVDNLVKLKLITQDEVSSKGERKVYNDYFYGQDKIEKSGLIGMQYFNAALTAVNEEKMPEAINNIEKSLIFYPNARSTYLQTYLLAYNIDNLELTTQENIDALFKTIEILKEDKDFNFASLRYYLIKIIEDDKNDLAFIEKATIRLSTFNDEDLNNNIQDFMYSYLAAKHADRSNIEEAIEMSSKVLSVNPDSKKAKEIITFMVYKKGFLMTKDENGYQEFEKIYNTYPFLAGDTNIETLRATIVAQIASNFYQNNDISNGVKYRKILEEKLDKYKDKIQLNPDALSKLYLFAGRKYYGKSQFSKALKIFEKGLIYNPSNAELQKMVKWAKEDLNKK